MDLVTDGLEVALLGQAGQQMADADVELLLALELRRERNISRRPGGGTKVQGSIPTWKHPGDSYPLPASEQKACVSQDAYTGKMAGMNKRDRNSLNRE